jgi:hypothetical protein
LLGPREIAYSDGQKNIEAIGVETGQRRRVFAGNTSSLPCNETGDVTDESAPCEPIRILATSPDGGRILLDPADYERRPLPLALASFDGSSAIDLPVASSGVYGASVIASAVLR